MRKPYLFTGIVVLLCAMIFISGTGMFGSPRFNMRGRYPDRTVDGDDRRDTEARAAAYGKQFTAWLNGNVPGGMVPAAAVGVISGERLVYHHGVRADSKTRFGIASLSKTFTAVLALRLQEEGELSLDEPVRRYLPGVVIERTGLHSAPVTVRHLLSHTSGMPSGGPRYIAYEFGGKRLSLPEQVHPAGYCYSYSNEGYELLLHVIEAATGKSYAENMKRFVLGPLGMTSSTAEFSNGTGGIVTTIEDLSHYAAMLINRGSYRGKRIVSEKSFGVLLAKPVELPQMKVDYYYSLGWEVITVGGGIDSFYKAGRWFNQASGLQVFPKRKIAFIYLCDPPEHLGDAFMSWRQGLTGMLRHLVRKISADDTLCTEWPALTPAELKWYEGEYRNVITGRKVRVSLRGGTLFSDGFGGFMPLRTFTSNRFLIDSGRMLHNFVWKENRVVGLALRNGYYEIDRE